METRLLRSFVVLAEEQHFGRAAARLHLAQPALSQQLKQLEQQVGARLLDRSTRRVEVTAAGRLLQERALQVLSTLDRTAADLALVTAGRAGRVRLGFVGTATYALLPSVARRVRAELPGVELVLRGEVLAPALLDRVLVDELDLAVLRPSGPAPAGLVVEEMRREALVVALPAAHRLAAQPEVRLGDLAGEPLVAHPSGRRSTLQPLVLDACRAAGFEPEVIEVGETGTLVALVAAGLGFGLVPDAVRALRLDGVVYRPLAGAPVEVPLALAHRASPAPMVQHVADVVRRTARDAHCAPQEPPTEHASAGGTP
ncbi:DNA-binding transcriptional regulator, LysR family [Quadrisphaera granulorum]|uniref:DNA-binding transcriptional LysR family regulator n=1 Tax=Quadrisphaera granulorum TaxID=317664 RepID=A0A316A580_9ACTN|nr:LysR family transcriptional regulator [Quadrisphaera granulorum]PWJ52632.1 DNA-binding transcriptional LysR family regulator [Quadrisphaera granulorum]SZE97454.1 DNA-binding transcriptional regulator, LysR family [Quadrisphaera granulorum]